MNYRNKKEKLKNKKGGLFAIIGIIMSRSEERRVGKEC